MNDIEFNFAASDSRQSDLDSGPESCPQLPSYPVAQASGRTERSPVELPALVRPRSSRFRPSPAIGSS